MATKSTIKYVPMQAQSFNADAERICHGYCHVDETDSKSFPYVTVRLCINVCMTVRHAT